MFSLQRSGDFYAQPVGDSYCGLSDKPHRFTYTVVLECADSALDDHGFIVDNRAIQSYFDELGTIGVSCELQARAAAMYFRWLVPHADRIDVRLSPFAGGHAAYTFQREMDSYVQR